MKKMLRGIALAVAVAVAISGVNYQAKESKKVEAVEVGEYELVWSDEFSGNALNSSNWNIEVNGEGGGNNELQYYTNSAKNIEVSKGTLKIHALKENYGGKKYTSGRINTRNKKSFKYGKVEAYMKLPQFTGSWPAFWMLGDNLGSAGWPRCGEIDIMEAVNAENTVYSTLHFYNEKIGEHDQTHGVGYNFSAQKNRSQWHLYTLEWDENWTKFYVDGVLTQSFAVSVEERSEFHQKFFIIFNLAIGGQWPGYTIDDTAFPEKSTMEVDYVRVYQKKEVETETRYITEKDIDVVSDANQNFTSYAAGNNSNWAGSAMLSGDNMNTTGGSIDVSKIGTNIWAVQVHSPSLEGIGGNTYQLSTTLESSIDKQVRIKVRGNDTDDWIFMDETLYLKANVPQTLTKEVVIPSGFEGFLKLDYGFGNFGENGENLPENTAFNVKISDTTMKTHKVFYEVIVKDPTTNTQNQGATAKTTLSEEKQIAEFQKKCGKAKVKVAIKKKSAKKVKVTLKKTLKVADGYQVCIYKSLKNAKKNKKAIVKYTVKTNKKKFTVSSKKVKNKRKLYIRVRGYKVFGKKTVYSKKWSVTKKIKVK